MALEVHIPKDTKSAPSADVTSLNLNEISGQDKLKPILVQQDDGVFDRRRGQDRPPAQHAHPYSDPDNIYRRVTGKDAPVPDAPVQPFKQHAQSQQPQLNDLGDQQQGILHGVVNPNRIVGNAITVGRADNDRRARELADKWDDISNGTMSGNAGRFGLVVGSSILTGFPAQKILRERLTVDKGVMQPLYNDSHDDVDILRNKTRADLHHLSSTSPAHPDIPALEAKRDFLTKIMTDKPGQKLEDLSKFNARYPAAFNAVERSEIVNYIDKDAGMTAINTRLTRAGADVKGWERVYMNGRSGLWDGAKFVAGSYAVNYGIKYGAHQLPGNHNDTDRIFSQNASESTVQGIIGASAIRNLPDKIGLSAAAWLAARQSKMTWDEAADSTGGLLAGTLALGLSVPALRSALPKSLEKNALITFGKSPLGKALVAEVAAFGYGRALHLIPGLGYEQADLTQASTVAWDAMQNDGEKMTGSSLRNAVNSFDALGDKWRNVNAAFNRDITNGIGHQNLPLMQGDQKLNNYHNIIVNGRTGLVLNESEGDTFLKAGLTEASKNVLLNKFTAATTTEAPASDNLVIAPNQGDLDLTSRSTHDYMQAIAFADVTIKNMQAAQDSTQDTSASSISNADIQAVVDEKKRIEKVLTEKIFRSAPDSQAHDIKNIVESTDGLLVSPNKFKLTDYAAHDQKEYAHMVNALENKAITAENSWLPAQLKGPNAEISREYVAKLYRDAAIMRLGWMNYLLTTQTSNSFAPNAQDVTAMKEYMQGSDVGRQVDGPNANRNVKFAVLAAYRLDKNNPDMQALVQEYNDIAQRVVAFNQHYIDLHNGSTPDQNEVANPFHTPAPANAR